MGGSPARGVTARLAAVGLARGPGAAVATVAFLTIAFSLALLAEGYRATLSRADREQAAFQVPLDVVVRENLQNLVPVFDAAPLARFQTVVGDGGSAHPVLRMSSSAGRAERVSGVTVLGLDGDTIRGLGVWRPEWGSGKRPATSRRSFTRAMTCAAGRMIADGRIVLGVSPGIVSYAAVVRLQDGSFRRIELGDADPKGRERSARGTAHALLVRLQIVPPRRLVERGADAGNGFIQSVRLSGPLAGSSATGRARVASYRIRPRTESRRACR